MKKIKNLPIVSLTNNFTQQEASPTIVEPLRIELLFLKDQFQEDPPVDPPEVLMADNRTMAELLQAPTEGYEDAIVIPKIATNNFELKHGFIELCCGWKLFGQNALRMLENHQEQVQSSSITSQGNRCQIKAIEPNCVTCGGAHSYQNSPARSGNVYRDNIQEMCHKPPQQITTKETPVSDLRWLQIKFDLPDFFPTKIIKTISIGGKISIRTEEVISTNLISTKVATSIKANFIDPSVLIPYLSRHDNERLRDQANEQIEKFYKIFKEMSFEISFTDALILMPKFASTLKALIGNKEKLSEMARAPMNEHFSVVILNKLPRKHGDPNKFLIPCEFPGMDECLALADLGASINLMPLSVCFLNTGRALIDVNKGELTLRIRNEAITYNLDQTVRYSANYNQMTANKIDVICKIYSQEVFGFSNVNTSGNPTPYDDPIVSTTSPTLTPFGDSDFLLFEEADAFLGLEDDPNSPKINPFYYDPEGDILLLKAILNSELNSFENFLSRLDKMLQRCEDTNLSLNWEKSHFMVKEGIVLAHKISKNGIKVDKAKVDVIAKLPHPTTVKGIRSFLGHAGFYRRFIQDFSKISRPMTHLLENNTPFIFSEDCIKAFQTLKKKLTGAPILIAPNWDLPFELMCDASDFAIGVVLGQRHEKHFKPIHYASKMMNDAESNYSTTEKEMLAVVYAFKKFRSYLIMNKSIVHTDHSTFKYLFAKKDANTRLLRWVLLLQEFDFKVLDTKGAENLATDHLSRLENSYENVLDQKEINETFPLETLSMVTFRGDSSAPWFADFANYYAGNFIVK
nr:reverse transcriptase domain-containing protein [Tanacetum cinerariifolium]